MILKNKTFVKEDTIDKLTIADSFVVPSNKLGRGNGEAKLYIGNEEENLRNFYGPSGFENKCVLLKKDLIDFLNGLKSEYENPKLPYRRKNELSSLFGSRLKDVSNFPSEIWFSIKEQIQIEGPRVYVNSNDKHFKILRELPLPNLSYLSFMKLKSSDGEIVYYLKLFTDYEDSFGTTSHPSDIEKEQNILSDNNTLTAEIKEQTIRARVGQGKYREDLLKQCPFCPITLIGDDRLLIASHIKPWAKSTQYEKLDPKNGFMFTPTIDRLFDRGFITFEENKKILISPWLSRTTIHRLNIQTTGIIEHLPINGRENYLSYHRDKIFKS